MFKNSLHLLHKIQFDKYIWHFYFVFYNKFFLNQFYLFKFVLLLN